MIIVTGPRSARRNARVLLVACGALVLAVAVGGCGGPARGKQQGEAERRSFPLDGKTLTIDVSDSQVDIVPADTSTVDVTRRFDSWVLLGRRPTATWRMSGHTLTLDVHCSGVVVECSARHEVNPGMSR